MLLKFIKLIFKLIKIVLKLFIYGVILIFSIMIIYGGVKFYLRKDIKDEKEKEITTSKTSFDGKKVTHRREWQSFDGQKYSTSIQLSSANFQKANDNRNLLDMEWSRGHDFYNFCASNTDLFNEYQDAIYWIFVYQQLYQHDNNILASLYNAFENIRSTENANQLEFAQMTITFVQDIPYTLIHELDCETFKDERRKSGGNTFDDYHPKMCLPEVRFGIQSPFEFCYNLKGDCDTRAVLLFCILKHFGYDVAVLYSREYAHAILGINIPSSGDFLKYKSKKYYVVETTARNWQIGQIPSTYNNLSYWKILLTSK